LHGQVTKIAKSIKQLLGNHACDLTAKVKSMELGIIDVKYHMLECL